MSTFNVYVDLFLFSTWETNNPKFKKEEPRTECLLESFSSEIKSKNILNFSKTHITVDCFEKYL